MIAIEPHVEKFKYIDPYQVENYLIAHGWAQQQQTGDKASIWTLNGFEILLPLKPEIIDFSRRMGEVVETLALKENRSQIEIFSDLITNAPNTTIQGVITASKYLPKRVEKTDDMKVYSTRSALRLGSIVKITWFLDL